MAMGTRKQRQRQEGLWYRSELPEAPGHPFYQRLNQVLDKAGFDEFCESRCRKFYHEKLGRPSLVPGMYFRLMLIGFFEGIESERGIAWRVADSLCLRQFLQIGLDERTPDHVTISRTRRLMDEATHQEVFECGCSGPYDHLHLRFQQQTDLGCAANGCQHHGDHFLHLQRLRRSADHDR